MNNNYKIFCFFIGFIILLSSCSNKDNNEKIIKSTKINKETGNIIYTYKWSKDSSFDHADIYDSSHVLIYKSYYEGNGIYKYISYNKNGSISDISYNISNGEKQALYQWVFFKNGKIDLKRSEFIWVFLDKNTDNNDYYLDIVFYTPLYPERKRIKIGYDNDNFTSGDGAKLDTFYFSKEYIVTEKYMPNFLPCYFYKRIKLENLKNGVNIIRGRVESYVYHGDYPAPGDSTFLFYNKYFVKRFVVKK